MSEKTEVGIHIDGTGKFDWLQHFKVRDGAIAHLAAIPGATAAGLAAFLVVGKLKDGSYVRLVSTLRLGLQAFAAFQGRYGLEADGASPSSMNEATRARLNVAMMLKLIRDREGSEVSFNIDDLNAAMQDAAQDLEVEYGADGKTLTIRATRSE